MDITEQDLLGLLDLIRKNITDGDLLRIALGPPSFHSNIEGVDVFVFESESFDYALVEESEEELKISIIINQYHTKTLKDRKERQYVDDLMKRITGIVNECCFPGLQEEIEEELPTTFPLKNGKELQKSIVTMDFGRPLTLEDALFEGMEKYMSLNLQFNFIME